MICPLCSSIESDKIHQHDEKIYYHCIICSLNFLDPKNHLTQKEEKDIYDFHRNDIYDLKYRRFLSRLFLPLAALLNKSSKGLDFGCGNGPALAKMFEEEGHKISLYDIYYYPDKRVLNESYDFIVSTEVLEHLYQPYLVLNALWNQLKPNGLLGVMTKQYDTLDSFKDWYYRNDPTHVIFFHRKTFIWLSKKWNATFELLSDDVVVFRKN